MFPGHPSTSGSGKIVGALRRDPVHMGYVAEGWPSLLEAMNAAHITDTPARTAAFLTTLVFESYCEYNILQGGTNAPAGIDKGYTGRGYIQLTGRVMPDGSVTNYSAAGAYLDIPLVNNPELAQSLLWSAKIAAWYWTVARPNCNAYADALRMGKINAAIGYPLTGSNDSDRCMVFAQALRVLTGSETAPAVDCAR